MIKVKKLVWDKWNIEHIKKHDITKEEVKRAGKNILFSVETYNKRIRVVCRVDRRLICLILNPQNGEGVYYLVTARDASKTERRMSYEIEKEKNS